MTNTVTNGSASPDPYNANNFVKDWTLKKAVNVVPKTLVSSPTSPLAFLNIISRLKSTPREGWKRFNIINGESVADHMYRMGVICMLCPSDLGINRDRCVKMALIHDMGEALVGDITPLDNVSSADKKDRELQAMTYMTEELLKPVGEELAKEFMEIWNEYEDGKTKEAVFVKDVDCFELLCQTIEYEKKYKTEKDLNEFLHVRKRIQNDFVKKWVDDALVERKEFWAQHGKEAVISN